MAAAPLDFEALADLRTYLATLRQHHLPTMNHYATGDGKGFWHYPATADTASLSSTATCVASLVHAGLWNDPKRGWGNARDIARRLITPPWESADLDADNPFSLSFIAQGVLDLGEVEPYEGYEAHLSVIMEQIVPLLIAKTLKDGDHLDARGAIRIVPYPSSAYLTQLVFRTLSRCYKDNPEPIDSLRNDVRNWSRSEIYRQLALTSTGSKIADPLQLAYATILLASSSPDENISPEEKTLMREALKRFFGTQLPDGSWPPSQPLFHYPRVGNARCYDYELLAELLRCEPLQTDLLDFVPELRCAAKSLRYAAFELNNDSWGWASGHHPQIEGPESWSTASVYDFVHAFDRLVAEAARRSLFDEVRSVYIAPERPSRRSRTPEEFAPHFLDATVRVEGRPLSLRETLRDYFVLPIEREKRKIANGGRLSPTTPMSAILFGPPGTSKTQLAKHIGKFLGWPVLSVDPSYLVQDGIDRLYARANKLFSMLQMTEQVVVLLDEFDELGRDRAQSPEILSRFITTSMLPKLAAINDERKVVFLLATNFVSQFDAAFSRRGRFDMMLQVMPPTAKAKLANPLWGITLANALREMKVGGQEKLEKQAIDCLEDLTFLETQQLVARLSEGDVDDPHGEFVTARERGTLNQPNGSRTWKETSRRDEPRNRLPQVSTQKQGSLPLKKPRARAKPEASKKGSGSRPSNGEDNRSRAQIIQKDP